MTYILAGCENNTEYYRYCSTPTDGWRKHDTLLFPLPSDLQTGKYEIEIGIRNANKYRYRDIWLSVSQNMQDTLQYKTDTLHLYLTDENGKWQDGDNIGNLHQHTFKCRKTYDITHSSEKYNVKIVHIMSDNPLKGIQDIGVRLIRKPYE